MLTIKRIALGALAVSSLALSGCATGIYPGGPTPAGVILTNVTVPAQNLAVATDKDVGGKKTGEATAKAILGLVAIGDSSISAAMQNGGIRKVHHVDHRVNLVLLGLYVETTTIVTGE